MMVSSEISSHSKPNSSSSTMANKPSLKTKHDGCLFLVGGFVAVLFVWSLWSIAVPKTPAIPVAIGSARSAEEEKEEDRTTFYDSPTMSYSVGTPMKGWDEKRKDWLRKNPSAAGKNKVLMITGSEPRPCPNPIGDHLLLRFFKNKVDYCRIHGHGLFYNNVLLHPQMGRYWAKIPVIRAAMVAHPEAEWIWWVDSDALFTDMDFSPPFDRYENHNMVVHGWPHLIHEKRSWTGLNAGVFLIRNSQWAMDFMEVWARMGPHSPEYEKWGLTLRSTFPDKTFPESDDQTGLAYLIVKGGKRWRDKIYLESEYYLEGYWEEIVPTYGNVTDECLEMERRDKRLRRRHAEGFTGKVGHGGRSRPFVTHFTGCQPCSGTHNEKYTRESCREGMSRALNFADNQVLRTFGFVHPSPVDPTVVPVPFDYPVVLP